MVEYEYTAEQDDELSLRPGDIITEVKKSTGGWWEGTLNGKRGVFPDNFVKEIKKETFKPDKRKEPKKLPPPQQKLPEAELNHSQSSAADVAKRPSSSVKKKRRAKVTYSYTPVNDDELQLKVGDVVDITGMEDEGWWQGALEGKDGTFPSNFVELISDTEKEEDEGKEVLIKGKKVKGIGLGMNIFAGGVPKLKATKRTGSQDELSPPIPGLRPGEKAAKHPPLVQKAQQPPPQAAPAPESKPVVKAKVVFPYTAENEDELSLEEGQVIFVLDQASDDSGWWRGRLGSKEGVFPDNFVELLPSEETKPKRPAVQTTLNKNIRPPSSEQDKVDNKDDKNKRETIGKRPGPPPPLGKKPGKNADPKLMAQTDDHKAQEQQTESADPNPKLKHPTKERPKPPMNRQPATVKVTSQKDVQSRQAPPAHSNSVPETSSTDSMSPRTPVSPPLVHTQQPGDISKKTASTVGSAEIAELRKQLEELREDSVPKKQYDELKVQFNQLKSQLDTLKKTFDKKLFDVMVEVDEEKKERIGLKVEVERVKKLVTPIDD